MNRKLVFAFTVSFLLFLGAGEGVGNDTDMTGDRAGGSSP